MKRLKHKFKKGLALLLSLSLVTGLIQVMPGRANEVQAATGTGTGSTPSVTAFATQEELMNAFIPDSNGNSDTIGKLVFGKKQVENDDGSYTYTPLEWYILGNDTGVAGDNIIIFAASPIISESTGQSFEEDYGIIKTDRSMWADCDYGDGVTVTEVTSNHYGSSDLRVALKAIAGNTNHFTLAEQALMNVTTVKTTDVNNRDDNYDYLTYTTTDKLYALETANAVYAVTTLKAGSDNQITLERDSYWSGGDYFWLRTPGSSGTGAFAATPNDEIESQMGLYASFFGWAIRPASNLNLSSVLFASSADTATSSGRIAPGKAMKLRFDGSGKYIGTAIYNAEEGTIEARGGSTLRTVSLVVQGNDGTDNWYYSKQITGTETVYASDIKTELGLSSDINLSLCRIWMEITDTNEMIYAVNAEKAIAKINTAFVTKEQLMNSFKTYSDGTAANYGKLAFGKNEDGETQEWYILGKDTGVDGDNTIIFAASPIATGRVFSSSDANKIDISLWSDCTYGAGVNVTEVYANHYGASDLRATLKSMAANTDYFTLTEQGMMNATSVTTEDVYNSATYTTTDKLYALQEDYYYNNKLWAGTSDSTVLAMGSYWNSGNNFWLRSPIDGSNDSALLAFTGSSVDGDCVTTGNAVQPASNLNLSSVLFASSAKAASDAVSAGTITSGTTITLRLAGTNTAIGTALYNADNGVILADKDANAAGIVSLVIQGNDGTKDWYYSVPVGETTIVTAEQIKTACGISTLSLADCKIWLETTIADMAYAKMAETNTFNVVIVNTVSVTGMKPVGGTALNTEASCGTTGIATTTPTITYTTEVGGSDVAVTGNADWNKTYNAKIKLATIVSGGTVYVFGNTVSVTIDDEEAVEFTPNTDGTLTVTKEFPIGKRKIGGVTAPTVPAGNIFTNYYGYAGCDDVLTGGGNSELGTQVTVTFTDSVTPNTQVMDVTWTVENNGGAAYDKTPGAINTFRWTIPASVLTNYNAEDCQGYDAATGNITGTFAITNKAATPVTIIGTDRGIDYTGETIDVSQYFTIDTNAGTPTYSLITGTEGGTGVGTLSGSTLTVTRTGTFKIRVNTDANGFYAAEEEIITLTVNNGTIQYIVSDYSGIYDGQPHSITVSGVTPADATITYSTDGTTYGLDNPSFTNAGTYTVYYRITKDNYDTINGSKTVTINKKSLTITAEEQSVMWGNSIDQTKYTIPVDGLITGDRISEITLTPNTTALTENGTISISGVKIVNASGTDVTGNYDIAMTNGTLKVTHNTTLEPNRIGAVKTKTSYTLGDALNVDDITVTAYYEDGYSEEVTGYTTNESDIDMSLIGDKTLTISYTTVTGTLTNGIIVTVSANNYRITDGAGSSHTIGSDEIIIITADGEFSKFASVKVDGSVVDESSYTVKEGSTIITLKADYLDTLSVGTHTIELVWTDGFADTTFTIKEKAPEEPGDTTPDVPATGNNTPVGLFLVLLIGSGLMAVGFWKKKKYIVKDCSR